MLLLFLLALANAGVVTEFSLKRDAHADDLVTFSLALKQRNLVQFKNHVAELSNPMSHKYGKWMSIAEINAMIAPTLAQKKPLLAMLKARGIRVVEDRGDNLVVRAKASDIERAFQTNVTVFAHARTKREVFKCDHYTIPGSMQSVVEFIFGLPELPLKPSFGPKISKSKKTRAGSLDDSLIIPGFIRDLYQVPQTTFSANSSLALVEFLDYSSYDKKELATMLSETNNPSWTVGTVVGPFGGDGLETVLDVQYGGTLARGCSIWLWTGQRWLLDFATQFFGTSNIPYVLSMSWGWPSNSMCSDEQGPAQCQSLTSQQYSFRVDSEFAKIAARGVTLAGASGDQGAPGDNFYNCQPGLSDILPASSLWVTAVGATQLGSKLKRAVPLNGASSQPYGAPICRSLLHPFGVKCADGSNRNEVACSYDTGALITTGGGFSGLFAQPTWQSSAVNAYLSSAKNLPTQYFNSSNRAFPDVSGLGHNYLVFDSGSHEPVDGTSASTPVFAALVALWNSQRLSQGKSTLGHIAPALYAAYQKDKTMFTDITKGSNFATEQCTSQQGFTAQAGYDPVTGLGTPVFPKLSAYFLSLP